MTTQAQAQAVRAYEQWLNSRVVDEAFKEELRNIANNESELTDRFYKELEFGTGDCAESSVPARTGSISIQ